MSWNNVAAAVGHGLKHRDADGVCASGIDEIARRKGHRYPTMVYDLSYVRLLWCGEGRDKADPRAYLLKEAFRGLWDHTIPPGRRAN